MRQEIDWEATRRYEALMAQHRADEFPFHNCVPSADEAIARAAALRVNQSGVDDGGAGGAVSIAHSGLKLGTDISPIEALEINPVRGLEQSDGAVLTGANMAEDRPLHTVGREPICGAKNDDDRTKGSKGAIHD